MTFSDKPRFLSIGPEEFVVSYCTLVRWQMSCSSPEHLLAKQPVTAGQLGGTADVKKASVEDWHFCICCESNQTSSMFVIKKKKFEDDCALNITSIFMKIELSLTHLMSLVVLSSNEKMTVRIKTEISQWPNVVSSGYNNVVLKYWAVHYHLFSDEPLLSAGDKWTKVTQYSEQWT